MATVSQRVGAGTFPAVHAGPTFQAYQLLYGTFVVLPIIAGLDKFTDFLTNWDMYLAAPVAQALGEQAHHFMLLVGVIEIIAGVLVAARPKYFAYLVAVWLFCITINLVIGHMYDVAARDFFLGIAAIALGRLAISYEHGHSMA